MAYHFLLRLTTWGGLVSALKFSHCAADNRCLQIRVFCFWVSPTYVVSCATFGKNCCATISTKSCADNVGGTCSYKFRPRCQLRKKSVQTSLPKVAHLTTWPGNFGPTLSAAQLPSAHVKISCVDGAPCICVVFMELGGRSGSGYCHVRDVSPRSGRKPAVSLTQ